MSGFFQCIFSYQATNFCKMDRRPFDAQIIKSGCVLKENKGMGSAQGGPWKPAKPADERFLGEPGTIKDTWVPTSKGGYRAITKIGSDGRATEEWHFTDHGREFFKFPY